jgi:hypothetical protein
MAYVKGMTDDELAAAEVVARAAAHGAPLKAFRLDLDGHRWVEGTDAYAYRANEWCEIKDEQDRRKLANRWKMRDDRRRDES